MALPFLDSKVTNHRVSLSRHRSSFRTPFKARLLVPHRAKRMITTPPPPPPPPSPGNHYIWVVGGGLVSYCQHFISTARSTRSKFPTPNLSRSFREIINIHRTGLAARVAIYTPPSLLSLSLSCRRPPLVLENNKRQICTKLEPGEVCAHRCLLSTPPPYFALSLSCLSLSRVTLPLIQLSSVTYRACSHTYANVLCPSGLRGAPVPTPSLFSMDNFTSDDVYLDDETISSLLPSRLNQPMFEKLGLTHKAQRTDCCRCNGAVPHYAKVHRHSSAEESADTWKK